MSNEPTPGPWIARKDPSIAATSDDWLIGTEECIDEVAVCSKRDAALIASAPMLLRALRQIQSRSVPVEKEEHRIARAAISDFNEFRTRIDKGAN